jgi:hypothetical protein
MKVAATCIMRAWESNANLPFDPGMGPLPGGQYEIDSEGILATLTTPAGLWVFQYPGHEGKDPAFVGRSGKATPAPAVAQAAAPVPEKTKQKMTEAHKKKMADGRARRKAELATA